ncbi:MAG: dihydroorotate dehydrogenase electron transfer subunit [Lachnospiraceae bacterium]|nr:dihydroorotate dehydrogenase electron transfer subunit [Lachnospiraceae bacterium]
MSEVVNQHVTDTAVILSQGEIATGIYSMWIETSTAKNAKAGQFISLYSSNGATLLPRPISICEINEERTALRLVYRVVGKGTKEFSALNKNDTIKVLGPLGNGYTLKNQTAILAAGGIGIPPIVELAKQLHHQFDCKLNIVVGYRNDELFLVDELKQYGEVFISTEDGSVGTKGNILDAIRENNIEADIIYACGPMPMLRAVKGFALSQDIEAQISLEERMACGIGACLGCVCKTKNKDEHTHVNNTRICTDGPVFEARMVEI